MKFGMELEIPLLGDMHVHLRHTDSNMLERVIQPTAEHCECAVIMPNTIPPTIMPDDVVIGRQSIQLLADRYNTSFQPLMMIKMEADCTPKLIRAVHSVGAVGTKSYPEGVTTNSANGLSQEVLKNPPQNLRDCWAEQEQLGMISSWHGEMPDSFVMDAEHDFLPFIGWLKNEYPNMKIVLEHITTARAVNMVMFDNFRKNLAATITYHHLRITLDDVLKHKLRPHHYCKPVAKTISDMFALLTAAFSGDPNFFLGSDSAPHNKENKECSYGCAGVYTAPVLAAGLVDLFDHYGNLKKLVDFACINGPKFYGKEPSKRKLSLEKTPWKVPDIIRGVVPFHAGETLNWQVRS